MLTGGEANGNWKGLKYLETENTQLKKSITGLLTEYDKALPITLGDKVSGEIEKIDQILKVFTDKANYEVADFAVPRGETKIAMFSSQSG